MSAQPRVHARAALWLVAPEPPERRLIIEAALERLDGLRDRLIGKLDAMDTDADLEPFLGAAEGLDQRCWSEGSRDDLEVECEDEGAQCDDEGAPVEDACNWQNEGDQTVLRYSIFNP